MYLLVATYNRPNRRRSTGKGAGERSESPGQPNPSSLRAPDISATCHDSCLISSWMPDYLRTRSSDPSNFCRTVRFVCSSRNRPACWQTDTSSCTAHLSWHDRWCCGMAALWRSSPCRKWFFVRENWCCPCWPTVRHPGWPNLVCFVVFRRRGNRPDRPFERHSILRRFLSECCFSGEQPPGYSAYPPRHSSTGDLAVIYFRSCPDCRQSFARCTWKLMRRCLKWESDSTWGRSELCGLRSRGSTAMLQQPYNSPARCHSPETRKLRKFFSIGLPDASISKLSVAVTFNMYFIATWTNRIWLLTCDLHL